MKKLLKINLNHIKDIIYIYIYIYMNVSILTITQLSRHESFKILIDYIQNQSYKNIVEWIIIDCSHNK